MTIAPRRSASASSCRETPTLALRTSGSPSGGRRRNTSTSRAIPGAGARCGGLSGPAAGPCRPSSLTAREWEPCGPLVSDRLESFPSLAGFLTGRRGNVNGLALLPQYGTFVHEHPLVFLHLAATPGYQVVTGPVRSRDSV